jgi:hypothetical protein
VTRLAGTNLTRVGEVASAYERLAHETVKAPPSSEHAPARRRNSPGAKHPRAGSLRGGSQPPPSLASPSPFLPATHQRKQLTKRAEVEILLSSGCAPSPGGDRNRCRGRHHLPRPGRRIRPSFLTSMWNSPARALLLALPPLDRRKRQDSRCRAAVEQRFDVSTFRGEGV